MALVRSHGEPELGSGSVNKESGISVRKCFYDKVATEDPHD